MQWYDYVTFAALGVVLATLIFEIGWRCGHASAYRRSIDDWDRARKAHEVTPAEIVKLK